MKVYELTSIEINQAFTKSAAVKRCADFEST